MRWKNKGFISERDYRQLYINNAILPKAYGLPKIHKPNDEYRLIISSVNSPLHELACKRYS